MRDLIEDYLDGTLNSAGREEVEQLLETDPTAVALLDQMKSERALRAAVFETYLPTEAEASGFAAQVMAACHEEAGVPVGHIGPHHWIRWTSGIAAGLLLAIGAFTLGRVSAPAQMVEVSVPINTTSYEGFVIDERGDLKVKSFQTKAECEEYVRGAEQSRTKDAVADSGLFPGGHM